MILTLISTPRLLLLLPLADAFVTPSSSIHLGESLSSQSAPCSRRGTTSSSRHQKNDRPNNRLHGALLGLSSSSPSSMVTEDGDDGGMIISPSDPETMFDEFARFLIRHQASMIDEIERADGSGVAFSEDGWGAFSPTDDDADTTRGASSSSESGGITRVIQGGDVVEKGACSLTVIRDGVLTADRASAIRGRQQQQGGDDDDDGVIVREGDVYSAAALSVVLHTKNPFVPTFRSDVRIFLVRSANEEEGGKSIAWFGGGSDLTPYYLIDRDIVDFHSHLKEMCDEHFDDDNDASSSSYRTMKRSCDEYFYLPARSEHRGTGGIFFDDLPATTSTYEFVRGVARGWMPSWLPIVERNGNREYDDEEKHWQCLRRGRYLEFNLLYDRGVKFGLANANPRVEGVMVSAPPKIAFDYNHVPKEGSEEERLVKILKNPKDWV
mmetsp:Transcript_27150/g.65229  ORF Transcript_27150/g.65229 Transcript_27150/m.65229 type:complete len:438 (+) Transcript_27150:110-1423(+)